MTPQTLLFCNMSSAKGSLVPFEPFHFGIKNPSATQSYSIRSLDLLFLFCFLICASNVVDFGTPFKIQWASKSFPKSTPGAKQLQFFVCTEVLRCAPLFPRSHSNYCAVGTWWFLKGHSFDGDWLILCLVCVSLCSVLYNMLITIFKNETSANAQPLNTPMFEEFAAP